LMPADLAKHFNVTDIGERGDIPPMNRDLVAASRPGKQRRRT
jgi:hypothetical protein